jgi:hypothetical protein
MCSADKARSSLSDYFDSKSGAQRLPSRNSAVPRSRELDLDATHMILDRAVSSIITRNDTPTEEGVSI